MKKNRNILCIVAGQRSGTTALQSALASTGKFENHKEIFHTEQIFPASFLSFVRSRPTSMEDLATFEKAKNISDEYINFIYDNSNGKIPLIDIKFNSWSILNPFWSYVHDTPFFMHRLRHAGCFFLFIKREDIVSQVLSEHIARAVGKWHGLVVDDVKKSVRVDPNVVRKQARLIVQSENLLWSCLSATGSYAGVSYEELYTDGQVNQALIETLTKNFGISIHSPLATQIKRNEVDKRDIVENFDELEDTIMQVVEKFRRPTMPGLARAAE